MCWLTGWLTVSALGDGRVTATWAMVMVMAMTWAMGMVTRLAGNKEGKGNGGKGDGDGNEGGVPQIEQWLRRQEQWQGGWQQSTSDGSM
jgi:hypothetical protein